MKYPDLEILRFRDRFLAALRAFFRDRGYLEVETPVLNPTGAVEAFLDPFRVHRTGPGLPASSEAAGYLITSPEYNLKRLVAGTGARIFEIAHCFRAGDSGGMHSEEFLMLEWYCPQVSLDALIQETAALLQSLSAAFPEAGLDFTQREVEVEALFQEFTGRGFRKDELEKTAAEAGLTASGQADRFDELFFSVFLNLIEPRIRTQYPLFVKHYPPELAALSRIENGRALRFELYWQGLELCNAYDELSGESAHKTRFAETNDLRKETGRLPMEADSEFLAMAELLGTVCGNALGIERLMMIFSGKRHLAEISPFAARLKKQAERSGPGAVKEESGF